MRTRNLTLHVTLPVGDPDLGAEIDVIMDVLYTPAERSNRWSMTPPDPADLQLVKVRPVRPFLDFVELQQDSLNSLAEDWCETDEAYRMAEVESFVDRRS